MHEDLAKGLTLHGVFQGGAQGDTSLVSHLDRHALALVVEIGQDVLERLALLPMEILDRDLDIVELNVRGACCVTATNVKPLARQALVALERHHEERDAAPSGPAVRTDLLWAISRET